MGEFNLPLLRKAVEWAEDEHFMKRRQRKGISVLMRRGHHVWNQRLWAALHMNDKARKEATPVFSAAHGLELFSVNPLSCGSTGCIAGHICVLAGDNYLVSPNYMALEEIPVDFVLTPEGQIRDISGRAQELLGVFDSDQPDNGLHGLFSGGNSIDQVREIAGKIARDHGEEL